MRRLFVAAALLGATSTLAADVCSPFDKDPANASVMNGQLPDGGPSPDQPACCDARSADEGCKRGCQKYRSVGAPVDTLNGFAWLDKVDVSVPMPWGPAAAFERHYSTAWAQGAGSTTELGRMGPGWNHSWSAYLLVSAARPSPRVVLREGDLTTTDFRLSGGVYTSRQAGQALSWDAATQLYTAQRFDGSALVFDATGRLRVVRTADGGEAQLRYAGDDAACAPTTVLPAATLCRVDFLFGSQLWFRYDANGMLAHVAWDPAFANPVVDLAYTDGYPTSATAANGKAETYEWGFTHTHLTATGVTVKLLTAARDADGTLVEGFTYRQPALSPSRVVTHDTPSASYRFSWAYYDTFVTPPRLVRETTVLGNKENLKLTWAAGALTSVCLLDANGQCDVSRRLEYSATPGLLDDQCERSADGRYLRLERDSFGRLTTELPGLAQCDTVTPEARAHRRELGYLGDTSRLAFEAFASVDGTAPAGFRAFTAWDYASPGSAVDPFCGGMACQQPEAFNAAPLSPRLQRHVSVGRTIVDEAGTWGTQVRVTSYTYDASGRPTAVDGPRRDVSDVTGLAWNATAAWALDQVTPAVGQPTLLRDYDSLGKPHTIVDANGNTWRYDFDAVGRLTSELPPGLTVPTVRDYYDGGRPLAVTEPSGVATRFEFDADGQLQAVKRMTGASGTPDSELDYERQAKDLTRLTHRDTGSTVRRAVFDYDSQGRVARTGTPLSARYEFRDEDGRLAWVADEGHLATNHSADPTPSKSHQFSYDEYGKLKQVKHLMAGGWTTVATYGWDTRGNLASFTDAKGVTITYRHDDFGRLVEVSSPDFGLYRYVYDEADNLVKERRPDGTVLTYVWDASNRLSSVKQTTTALETYEWGTQPAGVTDCAGGAPLPAAQSEGRLSHVADASGDWYFGYQPDGKLRFEAQVRRGTSCAKTLFWEYDASNLLVAMRYPSGARVEFGYPPAGSSLRDRPVTLTLVDGAQRTPLLTDIQWQAGEVVSYRTAGGVTWQLERDVDGSPWQLHLRKGAYSPNLVRERRFGVTAGGSFSPLFDGWRNPLAIEEATPAWSQTFATNDFPALTGATGPYGTQAFDYLASGDRDSADGVPYCYETGTHRLASVGPTTFRYAADGSLWKRQAGGQAVTLCYGPRGAPESLVGEGGDVNRIVTDFRRHRVAEVWPVNGLREDFRVDDQSRLLVHDGVGSLTSQYPRPIREYVWLGAHPVAVLEASEAASGAVTRGAVTFVHSGHLGEPLAETDEGGRVVHQYLLTPFGEKTVLDPPRPALSFETANPYSSEFFTVAQPGARAMRLHFTEVALASCDKVTIQDDSGGPEVGGLTSSASGDVWTDWMPTDRAYVGLQAAGCGAARGFKLVEAQVDWGRAVTQPHSETTAYPYPAAGQQFRLSLGAGGYVHFTGVSLASCDALEARTPAGQTLWKFRPANSSEVWSSRLSGDVDVGIWGQGCNATEARGGFAVADVRSDGAATAPVVIGLPGQRSMRAGGVENWRRIYAPELGRYLSPEPMTRRPSFVARMARRGIPTPAYSYAANNPLRYVDRNGRNPVLVLPIALAIGEALFWTGVIAGGVYCIGTHCLGDLDDLLGRENKWHSAASNPFRGPPGSCSTNPGSGQIRGYGADGRPSFDIDYDHDHGQGTPHIHDWVDDVRYPGKSAEVDPYGRDEGIERWENEGGSAGGGAQ